MKIDINRLAEHFAHTPFQVVDVLHYTFEAGWTGWQETMPYPGFLFQLGGNAELVFNGTAYQLFPGNVVHGGADMRLDMHVAGKAKWEYILVLYRIQGPEPKGICLTETHFELPVAQSLRLTELLQRLCRVSSQPGGIPAFQTETLFREVLNELFVCAHNQSSGSAQALFEQVSAYIHEHYMEALTIPRLAEQNGISRNRLAYVFYKYGGMGPGDYLLQYRLNRARELLLFNNAVLREIAQATGFNDPFYFSKAFKKKFGISPSEFRKKFINNTC